MTWEEMRQKVNSESVVSMTVYVDGPKRDLVWKEVVCVSVNI